MHRIPTVKSVMTPFPHAVDATQDLATASAMMEQHGIRHLPVTRKGELAGLLSERDVFIAGSVLGRRTGELDVPVWGVCTRSVYVVDLDTRVDVIADALADRHIGSALVTRQGKLVGIVTTTDICRAYADLVREQAGPPPEGTDAA